MSAQSTAPAMSTIERLGFEASVALEKDNAFLRGWRVGNDDAVTAKVAAYNAREFERCKAAALQLLDL